MRTFNVIVADDCKLTLEGIKKRVEGFNQFKKVFEVRNYDLLLKFLKSEASVIDILILDIAMPDMHQGFEYIKYIKSNYTNLKVLGLSSSNGSAFYKNIISSNLDGYIYKLGLENGELLCALNALSQNKKWYTGELKDMMNLMTRLKIVKDSLSENELKTLILISLGFTTKEIAKKLHKSENTIEKYKQELKYKFGVDRTATLYHFANYMGLISPADLGMA